MSVFVAIAGLVFLILIHEAGHFFVARGVGMKPRKFYIFFPPAIWKRTRNGIEYGIGAIPLGGYVKIPGMHRPAAGDLEAHMATAVAEAPGLADEVKAVGSALDAGALDDARSGMEPLRAAVAAAELSEHARKSAERGLTEIGDALSSDAYWRAVPWKRIAVIFAGPGVNLVFAVLLLSVVFALGVPDHVTRGVANVQQGSAAETAGLRAGDDVVRVNGQPVTADSLSDAIQKGKGEPVTLTVRRDGELQTLRATRPTKSGDRWILGFERDVAYKSYGPVDSVGQAFGETWRVTSLTGSALAHIVTGKDRNEVSSPVGIVQGSSEALQFDYRVYLRILALISLSLALLNLLPLLPLDGGHIAFSILEKIRGRAIPRIAYERYSALGLALVLLLFFIGLSNDVNRLGG